MRLTTGEQLREMAKLLPRYEVTTENADVFRARIAELEALLEELSYRLGKQKMWGGMAWHYNPLPPCQYLPLIEKIDAALAKKELSE